MAALIGALEQDLMPQRRQMAVEMYQAGSVPGMLSRQTQEPMSSYVLRREAWWVQLQELDTDVRCSPAILGEQMLAQAGLSQMEQQLVRTVLKNDLGQSKELAKTLREQFGQVHERERGKGRGKDYGGGKQRWHGWNRNHGHSYMAEIDETEDTTTAVSTAADETEWDYYDGEEYQEAVETYDGDDDNSLEEDIVAWYAEQGIHSQTCSPEDMELIYDTVEYEAAAYFTRQQASQRGYTVPASGGSYAPSSTSTPQERQARVLAAKQRTRCRACGQVGHWQRDWVCPARKGKGKGFKGAKGKGKKGSKKGNSDGKSSASSTGGSSPGSKPRVVYFSLRDDQSDGGFAGMVLRREPEDQEPLESDAQRVLEQEVMRLMRLPPSEVDRQFRQELQFVPPTSKSTMPSPPDTMAAFASGGYLAEVPMGSDGLTLSTPTTEPPRQQANFLDECPRKETTRRGTNAYVEMVSCKACGKVLKKTPKDTTHKDRPMIVKSVRECQHENVSWKGTNGYVWKWSCPDCGQEETIKKTPGGVRPVPGQPHATPSMAAASPGASSGSAPMPILPAGGAQVREVQFGSDADWMRYRDLLDTMVKTHLTTKPEMTTEEFYQLVQATSVCFKGLNPGMNPRVLEEPSCETRRNLFETPRRSTSEASGMTRSTPGTSAGEGCKKMTFGKYKGLTFQEVYHRHPDYVDWTLREAQKGETYCAGMVRWMSYCLRRNEAEEEEEAGPGVAYMVQEHEDMIEEVDDEDVGEAEKSYIFLDSGCNQTCHGEVWMQKFIESTGYTPEWLDSEVKSLSGIGGKTMTLGERLLYVTFESDKGDVIPGEIQSTELAGSTAPLLLSLPSQEALGLVIDVANSIIHSRVLGLNFRAIRGRRNNLLGLRIRPADLMDFEVSPTTPVALMADGDEEENDEEASGSTGPRDVPKRQKFTHEVRSIPTMDDRSWIKANGERGYPRTRRRITEEAEEVETVNEQEGQDEDGDVLEEAVEEEEAPNTPDEEVEPEPHEEPKEEEEEETPVDDDDGEAEDWWDQTDYVITRHHIAPRNKVFYPSGGRMNLPVDLSRLEDSRVTVKHYEEGGEVEVVRDKWNGTEVDFLAKVTHGVERYQRGPRGVHLVRRVTINLEDGSVLADESGSELMNLAHMTRRLPENVTDIRTEYYYHDDYEDECSWTGSTTFRLKPLGEHQMERKYDLDQEQDRKRTLTRGQKKGLLKEIEHMEEADCAMWTVLTGRQAYLPRKWSFVLELFCGCALLTRMCQAKGYPTCTPMDVETGWNVFNPEHRKIAEKVIDQENPYLVTLAFPCGPWSSWQRMAPPELVQEKRRKWMPIIRWVKSVVIRQRNKGGVSLLENPWQSEAWNTRELQSLEEDTMRSETPYQVIRVDLCTMGLRDCDSGLPHMKPTGVGTDSPGVQHQFQGHLCPGDHEHQPLEGSNSKGPRTRQAARWTRKFCQTIIKGIQEDLNTSVNVAFMAAEREEALLEESQQPIDGVLSPEDLGTARPTIQEAERSLEAEENLEEIRRSEEPDFEKHRRNEWLKIPKQERVGIRRLHTMTSHATRPQLQRMLRYSNAPPKIIAAVKYFRCAACERLEKERRPAQVKTPSAYTFGEEVGLDIFEIKDAAGDRCQVLHCVCSGTTFQVASALGRSTGVPSSRLCLDTFLKMWTTWAGIPKFLVVDRGTHNRGAFQLELEKLGVTFREVATEAPYQLGRTERHGGILKNMLNRVIHATQATGLGDLQLALTQCLEVKNQHSNMGGFSPAQWVLGRNPSRGVWTEDDEKEAEVHDEDPQSLFNRRGVIREAARSAWAQEDSHKRVRRALLRQGGAEGQVLKQGDLVSFMRRKGGAPKWYGPARVLTQEGKNVWIMHGGVPILTAENMVRPSSSEEHLEKELLGYRKGNKRTRGWMYEEIRQPHQLAGGAQPGYMDLRNRGDEGESFAEIIGYKPQPGGVQAVTERGDEEGEESPKRMRELIREEEDKEMKEQERDLQERGQEGEEEASKVGSEDIDRILSVEEPPSDLPVVPPGEMTVNRMDMIQMIEGGPRRTATATAEAKEESAAERTLRQRSRSPPERVRREFNAFMAKRSNPQTTGELKYEKE